MVQFDVLLHKSLPAGFRCALHNRRHTGFSTGFFHSLLFDFLPSSTLERFDGQPAEKSLVGQFPMAVVVGSFCDDWFN